MFFKKLYVEVVAEEASVLVDPVDWSSPPCLLLFLVSVTIHSHG